MCEVTSANRQITRKEPVTHAEWRAAAEETARKCRHCSPTGGAAAAPEYGNEWVCERDLQLRAITRDALRAVAPHAFELEGSVNPDAIAPLVVLLDFSCVDGADALAVQLAEMCDASQTTQFVTGVGKLLKRNFSGAAGGVAPAAKPLLQRFISHVLSGVFVTGFAMAVHRARIAQADIRADDQWDAMLASAQQVDNWLVADGLFRRASLAFQRCIAGPPARNPFVVGCPLEDCYVPTMTKEGCDTPASVVGPDKPARVWEHFGCEHPMSAVREWAAKWCKLASTSLLTVDAAHHLALDGLWLDDHMLSGPESCSAYYDDVDVVAQHIYGCALDWSSAKWMVADAILVTAVAVQQALQANPASDPDLWAAACRALCGAW